MALTAYSSAIPEIPKPCVPSISKTKSSCYANKIDHHHDGTKRVGTKKILEIQWKGQKLIGRIAQNSLKPVIRKPSSYIPLEELRLLNYFSIVPTSVITYLTSFVAAQDWANLQSVSQGMLRSKNGSLTISTPGIAHLSHIYFSHHFDHLSHSEKIKAVDELMSFACELSAREELEAPGYCSVEQFFKVVEAKNLLKMAKAMHKVQAIPKYPVVKLKIVDENAILQKADGIRKWFDANRSALERVTELDLQNCQLTLLPREIAYFKNLNGLSLNSNQLAILPDEIWGLKSMKALSLDNNRFVRVSSAIQRLRSLEGLSIANNCLSGLPKELAYTKCKHLLFVGNGMISLPSQLKNYKFQLQRQNKKLQMKTVIDRLLEQFKKDSASKQLSMFWNKMEKLCDKQMRQKLSKCLYEVSKNERRMMQSPEILCFAKQAFLDPRIPPRLRAEAISLFRKQICQEGRQEKKRALLT